MTHQVAKETIIIRHFNKYVVTLNLKKYFKNRIDINKVLERCNTRYRRSRTNNKIIVKKFL